MKKVWNCIFYISLIALFITGSYCILRDTLWFLLPIIPSDIDTILLIVSYVSLLYFFTYCYFAFWRKKKNR